MFSRIVAVATLLGFACCASGQMDFGSRTQFNGFVKGVGKVNKGTENFEESTLPLGGNAIINGPLVPFVPNGPFPTGLAEDNIEIYSHTSPNPDIFSPGGPADLLVSTIGGVNPYASDVVLANDPGHSFDLVFLGGNKTAVGFDVITQRHSAQVRISVYDNSNILIGTLFRQGDPIPGAGTFFGYWFLGGIGRINVHSLETMQEGADFIDMFVLPAPSTLLPLALFALCPARRRRR